MIPETSPVFGRYTVKIGHNDEVIHDCSRKADAIEAAASYFRTHERDDIVVVIDNMARKGKPLSFAVLRDGSLHVRQIR